MKIVRNKLTLLQVRRLPVGDGVWIARHKHLASEYVLDFIVERKNVDDLCCSIRDNRYRDQKLRLLVWIFIERFNVLSVLVCEVCYNTLHTHFWIVVAGAKLWLTLCLSCLKLVS